jgi:hypothetical protein
VGYLAVHHWPVAARCSPVTRSRTTRAPSFLSAGTRGCLVPGRRARVHRTGRLRRLGGRRLDAERQHGRERPSHHDQTALEISEGSSTLAPGLAGAGEGWFEADPARGAQRRHDDRHHVVGHPARREPSPPSVSLTAPSSPPSVSLDPCSLSGAQSNPAPRILTNASAGSDRTRHLYRFVAAAL